MLKGHLYISKAKKSIKYFLKRNLIRKNYFSLFQKEHNMTDIKFIRKCMSFELYAQKKITKYINRHFWAPMEHIFP